MVHAAAIEDVREAQDKWKAPAIARTPEVDRQAQELYAQDPNKATEYLTRYCLNNANDVVSAWWELGDRLLVKYNKFGSYNVEKRSVERSRTRAFPGWWKKAIRVWDAITEPADKWEARYSAVPRKLVLTAATKSE